MVISKIICCVFKSAAAVESTVNLWASIFQDDDAGVVALALNKHISTSKWPPSVAEIRELMLEETDPDLIEPDRAWATVADLMHAVGEHNYGDVWKQLPPLVARTVEIIGYTELYRMRQEICRGGKAGQDRAAFLAQYEPMYEREKRRAMTPRQITAQIDHAAARSLSDSRELMIVWREKRRIAP